jgi:protein involved in polysaccharide export with SLBB domain
MNPSDQSHALTHDVLATPSQVTEQLTAPGGRPVVHIPLPGWVWNVDRRRQWGAALNQWRKIDNLVIFVELPPASMPEAVLLGSNLPNLLWLAESGAADAGETRTQLQTLRDARCNLVGAVLNRELSKPLRRRFPRWLGCALIALAAGLSQTAAQSTVQLPIEPPPGEAIEGGMTDSAPRQGSFSVINPQQRAAWQTNLTLGPGDVLTFSLLGEPLLTQTEVPIAPDGRVSFLDARDVMAAGLTVDQLRTAINDALGQYRRAARCTVTPVSYRSKRYFVLGKVVQRGVYVLDRPTTVIEALARAKGIETGVVENDTLDLADYSRAFLMRNGTRMELDFEKLFQQGDLSQNIPIEPNDYLYFPPANIVQVYVLGEVGLPGPVTYRPDMTVLAALSYRGGFNERAYKSRVLVVRGSLNHPEAFAIDTMAITAGRTPDFKLEPKDIVYVSHRPFWRVEDLLDQATTAFVQSVVTTWVGTEVLPP